MEPPKEDSNLFTAILPALPRSVRKRYIFSLFIKLFKNECSILSTPGTRRRTSLLAEFFTISLAANSQIPGTLHDHFGTSIRRHAISALMPVSIRAEHRIVAIKLHDLSRCICHLRQGGIVNVQKN